MAVLNLQKILLENNTSDPDSITSLTLTHKALSDVSCLSEFKNLKRLDLSFNNLTSLEGLKSCVNLKWLSVVQNKLQNLNGIQSLTKLTVLNAGRNKIKSMDEVKSVVSLRALILNENEISSVCKLDQMKELNTLVLSRNPIRSLGESLVKVKSITKLSLANCQLQSIDSSLKSCTELRELRLAHNEMKMLPSELERLVKLQNLDMGNNMITSKSNLKVLSSLDRLRNLNLTGNPVAEKANLLKKVKNLLPKLHIFNARPVDKISGKDEPEKDNSFSVEAHDNLTLENKTKKNNPFAERNTEKADPMNESTDNHLHGAIGLGSEKKRKKLLYEKGVDSEENADMSEKRTKKKLHLQKAEDDANKTPDEEKKLRHKKQKLDQFGKEADKKLLKKNEGEAVPAIDSAEIPFMDLFTTAAPEASLYAASDGKLDRKTNQKIDAFSGLVTHPKKKKKRNRVVDPTALQPSLVDEIGLGGPSAWHDA